MRKETDRDGSSQWPFEVANARFYCRGHRLLLEAANNFDSNPRFYWLLCEFYAGIGMWNNYNNNKNKLAASKAKEEKGEGKETDAMAPLDPAPLVRSREQFWLQSALLLVVVRVICWHRYVNNNNKIKNIGIKTKEDTFFLISESKLREFARSRSCFDQRDCKFPRRVARARAPAQRIFCDGTRRRPSFLPFRHCPHQR